MRTLVTDLPEKEAMDLAEKLDCKSITYGQLPHLFGAQELPFVYDDDEVDFSRNDNSQIHRYQITTRQEKRLEPQIATEECIDQWSGEEYEREIVLTEPVLHDHFRSVNGEVIKGKKIRNMPVMCEIVEDVEVVEEI